MYICLDACRRGFLDGCRRVIGLDGCFLKGPMKGELLAAIGRDANNQMYPIAWAVVEYENLSSWKWFLGHLQKDFNIPYGAEGWVFLTDKQKGLLKAIDQYFPMAEHRMCARHIYANWRKKHRLQEYQKRFWKIAKASNEMQFNYYKNKLAAKTPKGWDDLQKTDPVHWCRAWFKVGSNCESVDNNVSESFNSWIIDARFKPIIAMLEEMRTMVTRRIQENRINSERWTIAICPNILRKINKIRHATQYCHVLWNGASGFEVRDKKWRFTVDLVQKTCSCKYWQVSGIPCRHACAALFTMSDEPNNYVNACFSIEKYKITYQHVLQPVEHESSWPISPNPRPLPPIVKKMPGRPQTKRRMDPSERVNSSTKASRIGTKIRCRCCNGSGHNSKTCSVQLHDSTSHNPSHNISAPLAIEPSPSKGKGKDESSSKKSTKRKAIEGYGLYYSERTGSSFIQTGNKRRLVSFGSSKSEAKASTVGNASVIIETSAGRATSSTRATINVTGGRATTNIKSSSTGRGQK